MNLYRFTALPRYTILKMIRIYQKTLSFDHGVLKLFYPDGFCRFYPTCSEYGYQAIERYGIVKGGLIAVNRIIRCNPFNKGGIDEIPK